MTNFVRQSQTIEFPVGLEAWLTLDALLPMRPETYEKMIKMLEHLRPAMVENADE